MRTKGTIDSRKRRHAMNAGTIKLAACGMMLAAAATTSGGCSSMQEKLGLGSQTARASEHAAADTINAQQAAAGSNSMQANDSGAGRQIGQAAGQEMFKKVP